MQSGDIRLFGDVRNGYGAVEIYSSPHDWQGICPDNSWSDSDAATICKDLGYRNGFLATPILTQSGPGGEAPSRLLYDAACPGVTGSANSFGVCSFMVGRSDSSNCGSPVGLYAAVRCSK